MQSDFDKLRKILALVAAACPAFWASSAFAEVPAESTELCAERPGQTTPPCTVPPGSAVVEIGLVTWHSATTAGEPDNEFTLGTTALRYGVAPRLEVQVGWAGLETSSRTGFGGSERSRRIDAGDLTVGALYGLSGGEGPVALQVFVTMPTGTGVATANDWSGGMRVPIAFAIKNDWQLSLTPEFDLAANAIGRGRHSAFGGAAAISRSISGKVDVGLDVSVLQDRDPEGSSTSSVVSASIAWQARPGTQLDIGAGVGLTCNSPHMQVYIGYARRL